MAAALAAGVFRAVLAFSALGMHAGTTYPPGQEPWISGVAVSIFGDHVAVSSSAGHTGQRVCTCQLPPGARGRCLVATSKTLASGMELRLVGMGNGSSGHDWSLQRVTLSCL